MERFKTLADAIALAEFAHRNQTDKAGLPYIEHPRRVMQKVQAQGALPYVQMAAILHDVTEDTAFTVQMLGDLGFSEDTVKTIALLDRNYSQYHYFEDPEGPKYIYSGNKDQVDYLYYCDIRSAPAAKTVKLADIEDNLSPWRLSYLNEKTQARLRVKYAKALRILQFQETLGLPNSSYVPGAED